MMSQQNVDEKMIAVLFSIDELLNAMMELDDETYAAEVFQVAYDYVMTVQVFTGKSVQDHVQEQMK